MRFFRQATALSLLASASALNILLNNDDSWASANIREFYKALKAAGHNVLLIAPAVNQSGKGGTTVFTELANLTGPAEFGTAAAGAPAWGSDPNDSHIWYYNGTPAAVTFFALDYLVPKVWNGTQPDLLVSGPNEGTNLGPFLYTLSGTIGAAYAAVERGVPAIAFSAGNGTHRSYTNVTGTTDVATLNANVAVKVVNALASSVKSGRLLPYGYGINVNLPILNSSYSSPPYVISRLNVGALGDKAVLNTTTNVFTFGNDINNPGLNTVINGDPNLPGETNVVAAGGVSITVFTVDYDAPNCGASNTSTIQGYFKPLSTTTNATSSGNGTGTGTGSPSGTSSPAQQSTNAGNVLQHSALVGLAGVAAMFLL